MGPGRTSEGKDFPSGSDEQLIRILDRTLKGSHPDGVSLIATLEDGMVMELHRLIGQPFNPHSCAKAAELKEYLWHEKRVPSMEPGGGITFRSTKPGAGTRGGEVRPQDERIIIGRKFFKEAEIEYRIIHGLIAEALGMV